MPQATNTPSAPPKLLHIFKPGTWTAMSGEQIEFSLADLQATAQAFNPARSKAPLVIGHPATDDPALGWVESLTTTPRGLFAKPIQVSPAFAQAVKAGSYGTVSAKFYRPTDPNNPTPGVWALRHIGLLGAAAPAVKGLDAPEFSANDDGCVCFQEGVAFAEWDDVQTAGFFRNIRNLLIRKFGRDEADATIPEATLLSLEQSAQDDVSESACSDAMALTAELTSSEAAPQFTESKPQESTVTEQEAALLRTQADQQAARIAKLEADQAAADQAKAHADNTAFCEGLAGEGRLLPAFTAIAVATLDHFAAQIAPVEFGEGEAKASLADGLRTLLKAMPKQVEFGEHATGQRAAGESDDSVNFAAPSGYRVDPAAMAKHNKALAHMATHKTSYIEAVQAVS